MSRECVVVTHTCTEGHETAFAVEGLTFDDPHVGTKALTGRECSFPGCGRADFRSQAIYRSEMLPPAPVEGKENE